MMPRAALAVPVLAGMVLAGAVLAWGALAGLSRAQGPEAALQPLGRFAWATEAIVGLSAIEVEGDGLGFTAIGDRGWLLRGRFDRDAQGAIRGVTVQEIAPILGNDGWPVAARRVGDWADAEGLAMAPDAGGPDAGGPDAGGRGGDCWIAFERWAHVARYAGCRGPGQWIRDAPGFAALPDNGQLEALALSPGGVLYAIAETAGEAGFPLWRLEGDAWAEAGHIPEEGGLAVTGADFGDDGWLYIVERRLVMGLWWQARIRRLRVEDPAAAQVLWTGEAGNLEGISVWRDGTGQGGAGLRLTLVTDDNGSRAEPTTFVEFRLRDVP